MDSKRGKNTVVTTVEAGTTTGIKTALSRDEELVVRMMRGLSEGPDTVLEFRGQQNPELAGKLALMEAQLLEDIYNVGPLAQASSVDSSVKTRIFDHLSALDD